MANNKHDLFTDLKEVSEVFGSSVETNFSLSPELPTDPRTYPTTPKSHQFLFDLPNPGTEERYSFVFSKLESTIKDLEESFISVNIRDDCSFQPKQVLLRVPHRRHTSIIASNLNAI
jgi:hypothetical protein